MWSWIALFRETDTEIMVKLHKIVLGFSWKWIFYFLLKRIGLILFVVLSNVNSKTSDISGLSMLLLNFA